MSRQRFILLQLMAANIVRRRVRSSLLAIAVGLVAAIGFLSVSLIGGLQHSLEQSFARLGADLLVVHPDAPVNLTQALLTVEPGAPPLGADSLAEALHLDSTLTFSPQRALRSDQALAMEMGLEHNATLPLFGIDPERDSTVQPWLDTSRGIDFQDGQLILGARLRGRVGDRLQLRGHSFQIHGRLAATGIPSHENGLFLTLHDLDVLVPSDSPETLGVNGLLLQAPSDQPLDRLRFRLLAQLPGVQVVGGRTLLARVRQGGGLLVRVLVLLSLALLISVALLISLMYAGIAMERRQEIGLLLSLGALPRQVAALLVGEASLVCALGGGLGLAAAGLVRGPLHHQLAARLEMIGVPLQWPQGSQPLLLAGALWLLITGIGTLAAGLAVSPQLSQEPLLLVQDHD